MSNNSSRNIVTASAANNSSYQNNISLQDRIRDVPPSTVITSISVSSSPFSLSAASSHQVRSEMVLYKARSMLERLGRI